MGDKRIYLLRNISNLEKDTAKIETEVYEILTDAPVDGDITFGQYTLKSGINKREGNESLILKIKELPKIIDEEDLSSGDMCYPYPHAAAGEIMALASFFLRRKFWLGSHISTNGVKLLKFKRGLNDPALVEDKKNLSLFLEMFELIENLNPDCQKRFINAASFYHRALLTIEEEPDMAYLHLVTSIEALSSAEGIKYKYKSVKDYDEDLYGVLESMDDYQLKEEIENIILKKILKKENPTQKFVKFIYNHVEKDFWDDSTNIYKIKFDELERTLKNIYNKRSRALHDGEPFPVNIFYPPLFSNADVPRFGLRSGEKRWSTKDVIPYPHFFERLVNHVLLTYLRRNQVKKRRFNKILN